MLSTEVIGKNFHLHYKTGSLNIRYIPMKVYLNINSLKKDKARKRQISNFHCLFWREIRRKQTFW